MILDQPKWNGQGKGTMSFVEYSTLRMELEVVVTTAVNKGRAVNLKCFDPFALVGNRKSWRYRIDRWCLAQEL